MVQKVGGGGTEALGVEEVRLENLGEGERGEGRGAVPGTLYRSRNNSVVSETCARCAKAP